MYYKLFTTLLFSFSMFSFSQKDATKQLDAISTLKDAKTYIENNKTSQAELLTYSSENNKTKLTDELFKLSVGEKTSTQTDNNVTIYKIISREKTANYKVSIIEFDSNKTALSEINSLRSFILKGLKNDEHKFENLARVYSNHPSGETGGDLGWLKKGTFSKRFEKSIKDNRVGKVYTFDEYRDKKHYIIVKTAENKTIEEITVFKISDPN